ncbi:Choline transporter-like protein 4 [Hondaea fermentalgiana]|uniref:Choline transporter-like protein n=1 Tax=Hondaea fermentalgiana TaxID=2315210 RepID=A0A2R5G390_9STRA|nr:Choline transporter-like protein 4 [Hondaea fermentalgiana]|eukprot:GBG24208.1 Choline transporter-like protein 4 [Hondaea fermentalgiana]
MRSIPNACRPESVLTEQISRSFPHLNATRKLVSSLVLVCFAKAGKLTETVDQISDATNDNLVLATILSANETQTRLWNAMGILLAIFECVYFLFIVAMWHRLKLAIKVLIQASKAIESIKSLIFVPLGTSLCVFVLGVYAVGVFGYIVTAGASEIENLTIEGIADGVLNQTSSLQAATLKEADAGPRDLQASFGQNPASAALVTRDLASVNMTSVLNVALQKVVGVPGLPGMVLYHIFGCLWTYYVISGTGVLTMSSTVSRWYWRGGSDYSPEDDAENKDARISAIRSYFYVLRYHAGTVCFGALLISTMQLVRLIVWYIVRQTKKLEENAITRYILCALGSCLWCTKWLLQFVTTNAYIMVGMHGCSFCIGAERAVGVLAQNLGRVVAVSLVNTLVSTLSILVIVSTCAILEYLWLDRDVAFSSAGEHAINSSVLSIVLTAIASFWVANGYMQVYEVAVETILLCFCQDVKLNRKNKTYVMSGDVRKVMARRGRPQPSKVKRHASSVGAASEPMVATT